MSRPIAFALLIFFGIVASGLMMLTTVILVRAASTII